MQSKPAAVLRYALCFADYSGLKTFDIVIKPVHLGFLEAVHVNISISKTYVILSNYIMHMCVY